jgi:hypothetical protein
MARMRSATEAARAGSARLTVDSDGGMAGGLGVARRACDIYVDRGSLLPRGHYIRCQQVAASLDCEGGSPDVPIRPGVLFGFVIIKTGR